MDFTYFSFYKAVCHGKVRKTIERLIREDYIKYIIIRLFDVDETSMGLKKI